MINRIAALCPVLNNWLFLIGLGLGWGLALPVSVFAQPAAPGFPVIRSFTPENDPLLGQVWSTVQDQKGIVYAGVNQGLVFFDGDIWRNVKIGDFSPAYALALQTATKRLYVGGLNTLGYLYHDSLGRKRFQSLMEYVPDSLGPLGKVWDVIALDDAVFFRSPNYLLRWDQKKLEYWSLEGKLDRAFWVRDTLFVQERGGILWYLGESGLQSIAASGWLKGKRLRSWLVRPNAPDLMLTRKHGLFSWEPGQPQAKPIFVKSRDSRTDFYQGILGANGYTYIGTVGEGIIVLDANLAYAGHWDVNKGLSHDVVYKLVAGQTGFWAATRRGLNLVLHDVAYRYFSPQTGLPVGMVGVQGYDDTMYVGGASGLFQLGGEGEFYLIPQCPTGISALQAHPEGLFTGGKAGLWMWKNGLASPILNSPVFSLASYGNWLWAGGDGQLYMFAFQDQSWQLIQQFDLSPLGQLAQLSYVPEGEIWAKSHTGLARMPFSASGESSGSPQFFVEESLPPGGRFRLLPFRGEMYVHPDLRTVEVADALYRYDRQQATFVVDSILPDIPHPKGSVNIPNHEDRAGNAWIDFQDPRTGLFQSHLVPAGETGENPYLGVLNPSISYYGSGGIWSDTARGLLWALGSKDLKAFDQSKWSRQPAKARPPILEVLYQDSIMRPIFGGFEPDNWEKPRLQFSAGRIRFLCGFPSYEMPARRLIQFKLEGYDQQWSDWTDENAVEYTGLREGEYAFLARGIDGYGQLSEAARFSFSVTPPWYRSLLAWMVYGALLILLGGLVFRIAIRSEQKKAATRLALANAEKDRAVQALQSRFFTNISHEFRTPLSLILGPVENWMETGKKEVSRKELSMLQRNAGRLLKLVNQLLDLARIDASQLKLFLQATELNTFFRGVCAHFDSLATQKHIQYEIRSTGEPCWANVDRDKVQTVLINLLGNAFKFTPDQGHIAASFQIDQPSEGALEAHITVEDSGPGIAEAARPHIFDRFFQSGNQDSVGSGIGLSLSRELIELMGGQIDLQGHTGAKFFIRLPLERISPPVLAPDPEPLLSSAEGAPDTNSLRLLVIDDNPDIRAFLQAELSPHYQLLEAADGKAGLEAARRHLPDLIISDLMMPRMDGLEMSSVLKSDSETSHIPIILLTARAELEDRLEGYAVGADAYLIKPFHIRELKARVKGLIEQRKKLRRLFATQLSVQPSDLTLNSADEAFLREAINWVEAHMEEPSIGPAELTAAMGMSRTQCYRKLKALTDQSPSEFIRSLRLKRAAQLLAQRVDSVSQIAYMVGFNNLSYFAKCFKEMFGVPPSAYNPDAS